MTSFTDIYKQELRSKGILSSLGTTALKKTRERLDPRNMLFGGSGMIAATGQKIFGRGYSATGSSSNEKLSTKTAESSSLQNDAITSLLASSLKQESQLAIIAKNTMNNNMMARDMNVMRQNMMKLVTLSGGTASRGADMFFKNAKMREDEYESKFKKDSPTTAPTPVKEAEKKSGGILALLSTMLLTLGTVLKNSLLNLAGTLGGVLNILGTTIVGGIVSALTASGLMKVSPGLGKPALPPSTTPTKPTGATKSGAGKAGLLGLLGAKAAVGVAVIGSPILMKKLHDDSKKEYLDLAKRKRDAALTDDEEDRLKKLDTPAFRSSATQTLNYDPIVGEPSKSKTPGQIAQQNRRDVLQRGAPDSSTQTSPSKLSLLDMIAGAESGKMGYDAANKGRAGDTPGGMPGLSSMTVEEVMQLQRENKLFAAGRYQIIPGTLADLLSGKYGNTGVTLNDVFDSATQDKLGSALIDSRLKRGKGDPVKTQLELSKEFASIADPRTGKSYYEGKGNNKASISTQQIQTALSGQGLNRASTDLSSAKTMAATQPAPQVIVNAPQTTNVAGAKGATPQVASATNIDALDLFFKFAM